MTGPRGPDKPTVKAKMNPRRGGGLKASPLSGEMKYRRIFENLRDAYYEIALDGTILEFSPSVEKIFKTPREQLIGRSITDLYVDPEERGSLLRSLAETGAVRDYELRMKDRDGNVVYCSINSSLVKESAGGGQIILGSMRDITERKQAESALRESQQRLFDIIDFLPDATFVIDNAGKVIAWNRAIEAMTGRKAEDMIGKGDYEYALPFYGCRRPILIDMVGRPRNAEIEKPYPLLRREGQRLISEAYVRVAYREGLTYVWGMAAPLYDGDGKIVGMIETIRDIADRKQAEETLRQSEERYRTILEDINEGYYEIDLNGALIYFNDSFCRISGFEKEELTGKNYRDLTDAENARKMFQTFHEVFRTGKGSRRFDWAVTKKDGSRRYIELSASLIRNAEGDPTGFRGILHDITDRKRLQDSIAHMAYHDTLTGLANRGLCLDRIRQAAYQADRNGGKFALMLLDLDHFKEINDRHGHVVGDCLLQAVGIRLKSLLRKSDTVGRIGGDEFLAVLPEIENVETAKAVAGKMLSAFRKPFSVASQELSVTMSIGIALYPDHGRDFETLIQRADAAMYRIKEKTRDGCEICT